KKIGRPQNIAELAKERLRLAGKDVVKRNPGYSGDLGFKVFRLDSSNISIWNPDRNDLEQSLLDYTDHIAEGRSEQDILYELLLKRGVDLAIPIDVRVIAGKTVHSMGDGTLFACLDEMIEMSEIEDLGSGIAEWFIELDAIKKEAHVVFRDSAFADDVVKTNMCAMLEQNGIKHILSL
ncbi:MAG: site-specific DNA-methyltransferase, partial [Rhodobacteraceae bacterium]|nr:site-specific DNA-methyltransferase [Paracoccaceae bacterium]